MHSYSNFIPPKFSTLCVYQILKFRKVNGLSEEFATCYNISSINEQTGDLQLKSDNLSRLESINIKNLIWGRNMRSQWLFGVDWVVGNGVMGEFKQKEKFIGSEFVDLYTEL